MSALKSSSFRLHELAFRTHYAEVKERVRAAGHLLPGTAGTLVRRSAAGRSYWYRAYQGAAGKQVEDLVCRDTYEVRYAQARDEVEFAKWVGEQVRTLRKLEFQVADKAVARVLVELYNSGLMEAGLCVVGTLAYIAWLNELGARATAVRTQEIDLAVRQDLKLVEPQSLIEVLERTKMSFRRVPGRSQKKPSSSVKLLGDQGLRVNLLTHGVQTGRTAAIPQLQWHAQTFTYGDFLLEDMRDAALLAGTHCIPVKLPMLERFVWHKLYSSAVSKAEPERALEDLRQAGTLAAALAEDDDADLLASVELPQAMRRVLFKRRAVILSALEGCPAAQQAVKRVLVNS